MTAPASVLAEDSRSATSPSSDSSSESPTSLSADFSFSDSVVDDPGTAADTVAEAEWLPFMIDFLTRDIIPSHVSVPARLKMRQQKAKFDVKDGVLHRKLRLRGQSRSVPFLAPDRRWSIIDEYHATLGHLATATLFPVMQSRFWWPDMENWIRNFVRDCQRCQLHVLEDSSPAPLHPLQPHPLPFTRWGLDFVQDLPETANGNRHIVTAICHTTKFPLARAVPDRTSATVAKFIFEEITCRFGCPEEIVTDRASAFQAQTLAEYLRLLGIHHLPSSPYHPRTNGCVERFHRPLNDILTKLCAGDATLWDKFLDQALLALRARTHSTTGFSPFFLTFGCEPRLPADSIPPPPLTDTFDLADEESRARWTATSLTDLGLSRAAAFFREEAQALRMKNRYDSNHDAPVFSLFPVGAYVKMKHNDKRKFEFRWVGPLIVLDHGPGSTYRLMRPDGSCLDSLIHQDQLALYSSTSTDSFYPGRHGISSPSLPAPPPGPGPNREGSVTLLPESSLEDRSDDEDD